MDRLHNFCNVDSPDTYPEDSVKPSVDASRVWLLFRLNPTSFVVPHLKVVALTSGNMWEFVDLLQLQMSVNFFALVVSLLGGEKRGSGVWDPCHGSTAR